MLQSVVESDQTSRHTELEPGEKILSIRMEKQYNTMQCNTKQYKLKVQTFIDILYYIEPGEKILSIRMEKQYNTMQCNTKQYKLKVQTFIDILVYRCTVKQHEQGIHVDGIIIKGKISLILLCFANTSLQKKIKSHISTF